jgi:DNA repair exonuclease SbcCD ATPase subunit
MRKSDVPRRSSAFEDLFAERQVYLRSGLTSRYVVLSRPLQIAVTIGAGLVVAGLAFASYSSVVNHLEAAELRQELALAEMRLSELGAARRADSVTAGAVDADTTQPAESQSSAEQRIEELTRQLATSDAKADRLQGDLEAALADATALRQAAETAEADLADLQVEMARLRERPPNEGDPRRTLAQTKPPTNDSGEVPALKVSLADAEAQIAALSADLEAAKSKLAAAREVPASNAAPAVKAAAEAAGADQLERVRAELRAANQRIGELEAVIRRAPPPAPPAPR